MSAFTQTSFPNSSKTNTLSLETSTNVDFNYPSLNRKDLMYLSTVTDKDFPIRKFKQLHTNRNWSINLYNLDIEGSSPRKFGAFNQKIDYINKNDDIEKSSPKILHVKLNKPEYNLSNSDIEYSKPHCVTCKILRHLNPLEPKYKLPKSPEYPPYEPKFIRDNINVSDIEGARPRKIVSQNVLRESLKNDDVKDSWPRKPYIRRRTKYEFMDYRDVTNTEFQTKRSTNPLDPFYKMGFVDGSKVKFGPIEGNKPLVKSKYMYKTPFNLKVDDIEGSNIGSKNKYKKFMGKNFCYDVSDILGTNSGSLLKGISTKRQTNPLRPKYKYLGAEELKGYYSNNPYNNYSTLSSLNRSKSFNNNILREKNNLDSLDNGNKTSEIKDNKEEKENEKEIMENREKIKSPISNDEKNEESKKILDKKVKITKNNKISIGPDGKPDFSNMPYVEDKVEFDKNKFKKPTPNYSIQHDKFLIPPIEEFKRNKIHVNPELKSFHEVNQEKLKFLKKNKVSTLLTDPFKTYANKLDDFMSNNNMQYNGPNAKKNIHSFVETGLPEAASETDFPESKKSTPPKIPERMNTES